MRLVVQGGFMFDQFGYTNLTHTEKKNVQTLRYKYQMVKKKEKLMSKIYKCWRNMYQNWEQ